MSRSSKHIVGYAALAVVLIATGSMAYGAVAGSSSGARSNSRTVPVQVGSVSQTVSATGNLQPASQVNANFQTSGTITEIDVAVGDQVTAGQVLAKLDPSDASSTLLVATLGLNAANAKLWQTAAGSTTTGQGATTGQSATNGSGNGAGASSAVAQAQLNADRTALADAQQAAKVNTQGYQLAVDQAQAQLTADQQNKDQAAVAKDEAALADAQQAQASGTQHDQQAIHSAQSKVDLDQAQLTAAAAASSAATTTTTPTVDPAALASAQASVIQAQSSVDTAQKALDATTLTAPSDGVVTSITKAVGDQVTAGSSASASSSSASNGSTTGTGSSTGAAGANNANNGSSANSSSSSSSTAAFTIVTPNSFQVKVGFAESDAIKVQVGQQAVTTLDALPGSSFPGTVLSIDQTATVTSNVVTYDAIVSVTGTPTTAKSGMTANVTVTTVSKDNVLEVPTAAVQTQAGSSYVDKLVNGQSVQTTSRPACKVTATPRSPRASRKATRS